MDVGPADLESLSSASSLLRLSVAKLSPATSEVNDAPSRLLTAADALGASDAQRCVVLQRSAVERTAAEIQRREPQRRQEVRKLLDEFHKRAVTAKQVFVQLQDGEATLVELWLLAQPK
jgi:hypothetical protein